MTAALITVAACIAMLAAALHVANRDGRRHDRTIDDILARRYTQPRRISAVWSDDTLSTAAPVRATRHDNVRSYGADVAVESLAEVPAR